MDNSKNIPEEMESDTIDKVLLEIEGGNRSAHLSEEDIEAFTKMKQCDLPYFSQLREKMKTLKCPLGDFDKAIGQKMKKIEKITTQNGNKDVAEYVRPPQAIYDDILEIFKNTNYNVDEQGNLCSVNEEGELSPIANFVAIPSKQLCRDDGVTQETQLELWGN